MSLLSLLSLLTTSAHAADCDVTVTGDADDLAETIASAADDSVVCVSAGTYDLSSRLNLTGRRLTIRGDGADTTTIRRTSLSVGTDTWVINVNGGTITLEDLTISGRNQIRALAVENVSRDPARLILRRVAITGGYRGLEGASVRLRADNHLEVYDSAFSDSEAVDSDSRGGHIFHYGGTGTVLIEDTSFLTGTAKRGGAIAMDGGTLTIRRSSFEANASERTAGTDADEGWGGGAIMIDDTTATVEDCSFVDNSSLGTGGAILVYNTATLTLDRSDFEDNAASQSGGHIEVYDSTLDAQQVRFRGGDATGGGAVACHDSTCTIVDSGFWFNTSGSANYGRGGGGIFSDGTTLVARRNLFCGNDTAIGGRNATDNGGGAIQTHNTSPTTLSNNVYMGNTTNGTGGALLLRNDGDTSSYESAVGNQALNGCGIYGRGSSGHAATGGLWALNSCASQSVMVGHGGSDNIAVTWSWFWSNTAAADLGTRTTSANNTLGTDPDLPSLPSFPLGLTEDCRELYDWAPDSTSPLYRAGSSSLPAAERDIGATGGPFAGVVDADGDGWSWLFDCDDGDALVDGPGALYADTDGDGYGAGASIGTGCPGDGESLTDDDCDDTDATINPGETEVLADGIDQDCDDLELCYEDVDGDGFRTDTAVATATIGCDAGDFALATVPGGDCDDTDDTVNPDAEEGIGDGVDQDCDDLEICYEELDGDGFRTDVTTVVDDLTCTAAGLALAADPADDCDDDDDETFPGADELVADGKDQSCDGEELCFSDGDADGFRTDTATATGVIGCDADGWALASVPDGDCDDDDDDTFPGATEIIADGKDQSCDDLELCYVDADDDDFRTSATTSTTDIACTGAGVALATVPAGDCDDADPDTFPGATELVADGKDQSCDGLETCYEDLDDDGFRTDETTSTAVISCIGAGLALDATPDGDCDDDDDAIYPGATEVPGDGTDQSCDGEELCFQDNDGDDFRTDLVTPSSDLTCTADGLADASVPDGDCDDDDDATFPGATEIVADGKDQSCDGEETCFVDADDDGFRTDLTTSTPDVACDTAGLALDATPDGDCDDENPQINPGADELWYDGVDQDCDGWSDFDQDLDGFDSDAHERLDGTFGDDCDDLDLAINPDADEVWYDAVDQDCDDASDFDQDGDGFDARGPTRPDGTTGDDCDDLDDLVFPGVRGLTDDCEPVVEQDGSRGLPDAPTDEVGPTGCACDATSPTGAGWLPLALGAALGLVRRRRR